MYTRFSTPTFEGQFCPTSGVLRSLKVRNQSHFDFLPADFFERRSHAGQYHIGDFIFRWRPADQLQWVNEDTAALRDVQPIRRASSTESLLCSSYNSVFQAAAEFLDISRDWLHDNGDLILQATLKNTSTLDVEIGAFGFAICVNNVFSQRHAAEIREQCVLADPYIGLDAGYVQVTRLNGQAPNLVITPHNQETKLEAWTFLPEPLDDFLHYQSQSNEGNYAWMAFTKAFAQQEWKDAEPWNEPTSKTLAPGHSAVLALRFSIARNVWDIENTVADSGLPIAIGLPGYVLPSDIEGSLYLRSRSDVKSIEMQPEHALSFSSKSTPNTDLKAFRVNAQESSFGRVRVIVTYSNGTQQAIHYFVTRPALDTATRLGMFHFDQQYYNDPEDLFRRAPSVLTYDYEERKLVLENDMVYLAGLSDEGGAGAFLTAAMKVYAHPVPEEVSKLEDMANQVIWGRLQVTDGPQKYAVRRSVFFWDPEAVPQYSYNPKIPYKPGWSWNKSEVEEVWRTFNAPHVVAVWYTLYRVSRVKPGIVTQRSGRWYLDLVFQTIRVATTQTDHGNPARFAENGMMGETLWPQIIVDLKNEGMIESAEILENIMRARYRAWLSMPNPFGSEMVWDTTGEPGVYAWSRYFKDQTLMDQTIASIRGFMPTVPHWGWNGNARRYWDFSTAGKLRRIERMLHHYGSGQNSLSLLDAYKHYSDPTSAESFHDLRLAFGGNMGALTNINQDGFASMAFHSFSDTLKWDAYSGDYGPNYLGHVQGSATYLVEHPDYGWVCMGGNAEIQGSRIHVTPKDTLRRQIYVASIGLWIQVESGLISRFVYDAAKKTLELMIDQPLAVKINQTLLCFETTRSLTAKLVTDLDGSRDGHIVSVPGKVTFSVQN